MGRNIVKNARLQRPDMRETGNICLVKMGIPVPIPIYGDITLVVETKEIE